MSTSTGGTTVVVVAVDVVLASGAEVGVLESGTPDVGGADGSAP
jgi:hypothetical protein